MDINDIIIKAVKRYPLLYKYNAQLSDRRVTWEQLSKETSINKGFLISRWHMLYESYRKHCRKNGNYFRYKDEMEFLSPYINKKKLEEKSSSGLEFIINESDIQCPTKDEYIFFEVEPVVDNDVEIETTEETLVAEIESDDEIELQQVGVEEYTYMERKNTGELSTTVVIQEEDNDELHTENPMMEASMEEEILAEVELVENNSSEAESTTEILNIICEAANEGIKNVKAPIEGRHEDVVFGELITSMLIPMNEERKRIIKKRIMNILLS